MLNYLNAKAGLSNIAYRQGAAHHDFFAAARTSTFVRVRDKATFFEALRLQHRPEAPDVNSRGGTLYQARPLVSRVPQELTEPLLW